MDLNVEPTMHPIFADHHAMRSPSPARPPVALFPTGAQKYAYVDMEAILQHLPEYADLRGAEQPRLGGSMRSRARRRQLLEKPTGPNATC